MKKSFYCILVILMASVFSLYGCKARPQEPATGELSNLQEASDFTLSDQPSEEGASLETKINELNATMSVEVTAANTTESSSELSGDFSLPTPHAIQRALKNAGLYTATIDGIIGPKTKEAIRQFQKDNNLTVDGVIGKKSWAQLKKYLD